MNRLQAYMMRSLSLSCLPFVDSRTSGAEPTGKKSENTLGWTPPRERPPPPPTTLATFAEELGNYVTLFVSGRPRRADRSSWLRGRFLEGGRTHSRSSGSDSWGKVADLDDPEDEERTGEALSEVENGRDPSPGALLSRGIDRRVNKKASARTLRGDPRVPGGPPRPRGRPFRLSRASYSLGEQRRSLTREQCRRETALGMLDR